MFDVLIILLVGIFLPLFPFSMVFNAILDNTKQLQWRVLIFLVWPLCGVLLVRINQVTIPDWVLPLAIFTSFLYALRMLTLREVNQWGGFLAISLWSLIWLPMLKDTSTVLLLIYALSMTMPLVLLLFLCVGLEKRFGAAYTGLDWGLVRTIPNFAVVFVTVLTASIATPLFPSFFIMFEMVVESSAATPWVAVSLLLIWLLWSWAGTRVIQGLIVGRACDCKVDDMDARTISGYGVVLLVLLVSGIYLSGVIL